MSTPILLNMRETNELTLLGARGIRTLDACSLDFLDRLLGTMVLQLNQHILQYGDDFQVTVSVGTVSRERKTDSFDTDYSKLHERHELQSEAPFLFIDM